MSEALPAVVVLGASGFVGGALVASLRQKKFSVTALARPMFDLRDVSSFATIPPDAGVVVHAAGAVGRASPAADCEALNIVATRALVEFLNRRHRPPYLLYLSTGGVYGPLDGPAGPDTPPAATDCYAASKLQGERIVMGEYLGASACARLYFPYGPGQGGERLIPTLISRIRSGLPIKINRGGRPRISPIYIDDLTAMLSDLILGCGTGIYNVCGNEIVTIAELARIIGLATQRTPFVEKTGIDVLDYCAHPDIGKPVVGLAEGIRRTLTVLERQ